MAGVGKQIADEAKNRIKNKLKQWAKAIAIKILTSPIFWIVMVVLFVIIIIIAVFSDNSANAATQESESDMIGTSDDQWEQFIRYVSNFEGGLTVVKNNKGEECYRIESDGDGGYAVIGLDTRVYGDYFKSLGYGTNEGDLIPKDIAIKKREEEIKNNYYSHSEEYCASEGIKLTQYQLFALTSRAFNHGHWGAFYKVYGNESFKDAYKHYWNQSSDDKFKKTKNPDLNHKLYTQAMNQATNGGLGGLVFRRESEFRLFQCGWYYTTTAHCAGNMDEQFIESSSSSGSGNIIEIAKEMKKQLHDEGFHYSYSNIAQTFEESRKGNKNLVCATFCSWVLQKAGAIDSHTDSSSGLAKILEGRSDWKKVYETTTGDISKLQPGDVLWYNVEVHSEIYAGNKKSFNVGIQSHIDSTGGPTNASFTMGGYKSFKVYRYKNNNSNNSSSGSGTGKISNGTYSAVVSGRKYTIYNQNDKSKAWYSKDGCFHCSIAMCISGFGENIPPNKLPGFRRGSGCYGSTDATQKMLKKCKISGLITSVSSSKIREELKKGNAIYAHVQGRQLKVEKGSYTYGGHWVAVVDYKKSGGKEKIFLLDPWEGVVTGWGDLSTNCNAFTEYRVVSKK